jgi:hypothetical protein
MKRIRDPMDYQKWAALGSNVKRLRSELSGVLCDHELQGHLTKQETEPLQKAIHCIDKFRTNCENQMWIEIRHRYINPRDLFNVFYGDNQEPFPEPELYEGY